LRSDAGVEIAGPLSDDRTRDRHHLGIEIALGAAELWSPNFTCSARLVLAELLEKAGEGDFLRAVAEGFCSC
jgi:hypothetical protein